MKRAHLILPLIIAVLGIVLLAYCFSDSVKAERKLYELDRRLWTEHAELMEQDMKKGYPMITNLKEIVRSIDLQRKRTASFGSVIVIAALALFLVSRDREKINSNA